MIEVAVIDGRAYRVPEHQHEITAAILGGVKVCWHPLPDLPVYQALWKVTAERLHESCLESGSEERCRSRFDNLTFSHFSLVSSPGNTPIVRRVDP